MAAEWQRIRYVRRIKVARHRIDQASYRLAYNATISAVDASEARSRHPPEGEGVGRVTPRCQTQYVDVYSHTHTHTHTHTHLEQLFRSRVTSAQFSIITRQNTIGVYHVLTKVHRINRWRSVPVGPNILHKKLFYVVYVAGPRCGLQNCRPLRIYSYKFREANIFGVCLGGDSPSLHFF